MQENYQIDLTYWDYEEIMMLSGPCDKYLQLLRESFDSDVFILENALQIIGNEKTFKDISKIVKACFELIRSTKQLSETDFRYILKLVRQNPNIKIDFTNYEPVAKTVTGKLIFPKTIGQRLLVSAIEHNEIIFASGVAGTGKTYLAVMAAVSQLKKETIPELF